MKNISILILALLLTSCAPKDPANQCLDSFRSKLKDPASGRVVDFKDNILTYTATNSYGARLQGKALCEAPLIKEGTWKRNYAEEYIQILNRVTDKLKKSNDCRATGKKAIECTGGSQVLKLSAISLGPSDQEALEEEAAQELGYR